MTKKTMDVLIITGIFPPDIGGPATYVPQIARGLAERGHEITVLTLSDRVDHDDRGYPFGVVRIQRGLFKPLRILLTACKVLRLGKKAEVLFVNGLFLESVIANFFLRRPMVQKVVGDWAWEKAVNRSWVQDDFEDFQRKRYGLRVEAMKALRGWLAHQSHKVIVPSWYLARWVTDWGIGEEKITVIYNAVEPVNGIRPAEIPLQTRFKVVTAGRLVPWKCVDGIIEAITHCESAGLVIIGDGLERGRLRDLVRSSRIEDRIFFAGQRSRQETLTLMAACDLFVLNSTYEGFPHVVLEAMQVGLPVIATDVGGSSEVVKNGENGCLIALSGNGSLREVLSQVLADPLELRRLVEGAQQTVKRFGIARMLEETTRLLASTRRSALDER